MIYQNVIFLVVVNISITSSYNLATKEEAVNFVRSPLASLAGDKHGSGARKIPKSSFFGYSFLFTEGDNPRLMVGAPKLSVPVGNSQDHTGPKSSEQGSRGSINVCEAALIANITDTCRPANPRNPQNGDSFGLEVSIDPSGRSTACAPTRELKCGSNTSRISPGFCYNSPDFGETWNMTQKSKNQECLNTVEILFVLDGSHSVGSDFSKVKEWVKNTTKRIGMEENGIRVGVLQYSSYVELQSIHKQMFIKTHIKIGQYQRFEDFAEKVDNITLFGKETYTGEALRKVKYDFENTDHYNKTSTKQVMILLTDGKANDKDLVPENAAQLRSIGVTTFALGVGDVNQTELQIIGNGVPGNDTRVFTIKDYSGLDAIAKELETEIGTILEGDGPKNKSSYKMEFAELGLSATYSKSNPEGIYPNGRLYLGAVGAYDWSGTVTKYDTVSDTQPDIPDYAEVQKVLPERTKESYMGYSVTTGYFTDRTTEYVATGAPRYQLMGAVVIYRPINNNNAFNDHVTLMGNKQQLGSYFGGSVMTADVNNDGRDDLFVGAPLYVHDNFDEGRVFVYISNGTSILTTWANENYQPLELEGDNLPGGRFGTAMADAGDLNKDGYNDVIVGAPLTDSDRGAVFVYHGSRTGMDTKFKQKILASEMTGVTLKYFGQSLQGGVDLDGNKYPDIAVGAPKSDTVVIFRSRPVVAISAEIRYTNSTLDIFECIDKNYESCARLQVCFTANGVSVENQIGITFNVTIDTQKVGADKRLEFKEGQENAKPTWSQETFLTKGARSCFARDLHMKRSVKDYDAVITAEVEYDLLANHTAQPLSSVRDPSISNKETASMSFVKNCGDDGKCIYDLRLEASINVPQYMDSQGKDVTNNGQILVIDQTMADTTVKVNLSNHKENAFDTRIKFAYTSLISLSAFTNKIGYPASNSCIVEESDPQDLGNGTRVQVLRYNYKTNIMQQDAWCYFEFSLRIENLKNSGTMDTLWLNVTAYTSDSSTSSEESDPDDNFVPLSRGILYRSNFDLKKKKEGAQTPFNYTTEAAYITSVYEIGNKTADIEMEFELTGQGYSNIPQLDASLNYPFKTSNGYRLFYLYKVECTPKDGSKASCSCDQNLVNEYNLTLEAPTENNTIDNGTIEITPPLEPIEAPAFDCYTKGDKNFTCAMLKCSVENLRQSDQVVFKAYFRLWTSSIMFNGTDFEEIRLLSRFEVDSNNSLYIIDKNGETGLTESQEILWTARKFKSNIAPESSQALWIYIVAAIGGLLLLIILVLILWKVGFFKSKYADMKKDAQDEIADETEFANGNGSQVEMAG